MLLLEKERQIYSFPYAIGEVIVIKRSISPSNAHCRHSAETQVQIAAGATQIESFFSFSFLTTGLESYQLDAWKKGEGSTFLFVFECLFIYLFFRLSSDALYGVCWI